MGNTGHGAESEELYHWSPKVPVAQCRTLLVTALEGECHKEQISANAAQVALHCFPYWFIQCVLWTKAVRRVSPAVKAGQWGWRGRGGYGSVVGLE